MIYQVLRTSLILHYRQFVSSCILVHTKTKAGIGDLSNPKLYEEYRTRAGPGDYKSNHGMCED